VHRSAEREATLLERIFLELMTSTRKLEVSREGPKWLDTSILRTLQREGRGGSDEEEGSEGAGRGTSGPGFRLVERGVWFIFFVGVGMDDDRILVTASEHVKRSQGQMRPARSRDKSGPARSREEIR